VGGEEPGGSCTTVEGRCVGTVVLWSVGGIPAPVVMNIKRIREKVSVGETTYIYTPSIRNA
jgi:hypothetical protein